MGKNSVGTARVAEQPYPPKKRISGNSARMRDVAKRAGVSTMTVSRALNEPSKVRDMSGAILPVEAGWLAS
jgi:hypothetical protein